MRCFQQFWREIIIFEMPVDCNRKELIMFLECLFILIILEIINEKNYNQILFLNVEKLKNIALGTALKIRGRYV